MTRLRNRVKDELLASLSPRFVPSQTFVSYLLLTSWWFSPGIEVSCINKTDSYDITKILLIVFGLTRLWLEPTTYHTRGKHAIHYTTDAVHVSWYGWYVLVWSFVNWAAEILSEHLSLLCFCGVRVAQSYFSVMCCIDHCTVKPAQTTTFIKLPPAINDHFYSLRRFILCILTGFNDHLHKATNDRQNAFPNDHFNFFQQPLTFLHDELTTKMGKLTWDVPQMSHSFSGFRFDCICLFIIFFLLAILLSVLTSTFS